MDIFKKKQQQTMSTRPVLGRGAGRLLATDPFTDWTIILGAAVVIVAVLVWADISVYRDSASRLVTSVSAPSPRPSAPIDADALGRALESFSARVKDGQDVLHGFEAPADPFVP